jgi:hypothetical protein
MRTRQMAALVLAAVLAAGCDAGPGAGGAAKGGGGKHHGRHYDAKKTAMDTASDTLDYDEEDAGDTHHRWQVKTTLAPGADPARATAVRIDDLLALPEAPGVTENDGRYQNARITGPVGRLGLREGQMVTTSGWLHLVAHPADGDYHLQLTGSPTEGDHCLIVEIPDPDRVTDAQVRALASAAREWVRAHALGGDKPEKKGTELEQPIYVTVTGALFYDDAHVSEKPRGKRGEHAATLWEIHPVTSIAAAQP